MPKYIIGGMIQYYCAYPVEADNEQEAIRKLDKLYPDARDMHIQFVELEDDDTVINDNDYKTFNEAPYGND